MKGVNFRGKRAGVTRCPQPVLLDTPTRMLSDKTDNTNDTSSSTDKPSPFTSAEAAQFSCQGASIVPWPSDQEWKDPLPRDESADDNNKDSNQSRVYIDYST